MEHAHHHPAGSHYPHGGSTSLNRTAFMATLHCLAGCAIGEVAGMVIGTALGWSNAATIGLAVVLAFLSGFALTALPLLRAGLAPRTAMRVAVAADAVSITVMEVVDNAVMMAIPGAMDASLATTLFWISLAGSLGIAALVVFPVNRWLIARGKGHALAHGSGPAEPRRNS
jgi:uncharacterized membrane protein